MTSLFYNRYVPPPLGLAKTPGKRPAENHTSGVQRKWPQEVISSPDADASVVANSAHSQAKTQESTAEQRLPTADTDISVLSNSAHSKAQTQEKQHLSTADADISVLSNSTHSKAKTQEPTVEQRLPTADADFSAVSKSAHKKAKSQQFTAKVHAENAFPQPEEAPGPGPPPLAWTDAIEYTDSGAPFSALPLPSSILDSLGRSGFVEATPVQAKLLEIDARPVGRQFRDICVQTPTGSGKTLAYALPMVRRLRGSSLQALVVLPSSTLVAQAAQTLTNLGSDLRVLAITGDQPRTVEAQALLETREVYDPGAERMPSDEALHAGWVHSYVSRGQILVCTPWGLVRHVRETPGFTLQHVQWLVVDEVDQCIERNHKRWIDIVMPLLNRKPCGVYDLPIPVRKTLLSATMQRDLVNLRSLFKLRRPMLVVSNESPQESTAIPENLTEIAYKMEDAEHKPLHLIRLLDQLLGENTHLLVFTSSSSTAHRLSRFVQLLCAARNDQIKALTALTSRPQRGRMLAQFQDRRFPVLVTTDLLAHGIDFEGLTHVINYDMPRSAEEYVHRVGRTARAGKSGTAITLVEHKQARWYWQAMEEITRTETVQKRSTQPVGETERQAFNAAVEALFLEAQGDGKRA